MNDYNRENYMPEMSCPVKRDYTTYYVFSVYSKGSVVTSGNAEKVFKDTNTTNLYELRSLCKANKYILEEVVDEEEYKKASSEFRKELNQIDIKFKRDLGNDLGIDFIDDPVGVLIYSMAYEKGHSAGMNEIALYALEYTDIMRDIIRKAPLSNFCKEIINE